jgi:hypothetical protein
MCWHCDGKGKMELFDPKKGEWNSYPCGWCLPGKVSKVVDLAGGRREERSPITAQIRDALRRATEDQ